MLLRSLWRHQGLWSSMLLAHLLDLLDLDLLGSEAGLFLCGSIWSCKSFGVVGLWFLQPSSQSLHLIPWFEHWNSCLFFVGSCQSTLHIPTYNIPFVCLLLLWSSFWWSPLVKIPKFITAFDCYNNILVSLLLLFGTSSD